MEVLNAHQQEMIAQEILSQLEDQKPYQLIATLRLTPCQDGDQWCFLFGKNTQEGIAGFGNTVYEAMWDFYRNFHTKKAGA